LISVVLHWLGAKAVASIGLGHFFSRQPSNALPGSNNLNRLPRRKFPPLH